MIRGRSIAMRLQPTGSGEYFRLRRVAEVVNDYAPNRGRVVDVGGGSGLLYRWLRADLRSAYAVVDDQESGYGERITGDLWANLNVIADADVVVLSDVLEHVRDDLGFVTALRHHTRPATSLVFHVPHLRKSPFQRLHKMREEAELADTQAHPHVRDGYDSVGLRALLSAGLPGYEVQVVGSMTFMQTAIADADWLLWCKRLNPLRATTYLLTRTIARRRPYTTSEATAGLLAVATSRGSEAQDLETAPRLTPSCRITRGGGEVVNSSEILGRRPAADDSN